MDNEVPESQSSKWNQAWKQTDWNLAQQWPSKPF